MAKSKAKQAKRGKNKAAQKPKTVDTVEAKLTEKENAAVEAEVVDEELDEEVENVEEVEETEEIEEAEVEEEESEGDEPEEEDSDDEDEDSEDEEDDDDDSDDDEEESEEEESDDDEEEDEDEDDDDEEAEKALAAAKAQKEAEKKAKKEAKKKAKAEKKAAAAAAVNENSEVITSKKPSAFKTFFARKFDKSENILTIFTNSKIVGAIIGELIGTMLVSMVALTLGLLNPLYLIFAYLGVTLLVFKLSGANLNPAITAGMLASRRMSAIRGVLYIIAQVLGAWLGYVIINAFLQAGISTGNVDAAQAAFPALSQISEIPVTKEGASYFWPVTMVEFLTAAIIGFAYARALQNKENSHNFAITLSAGIFLALVFAALISSSYLGISTVSFVANPAVAVIYGLLPSSAAGFDALMQALLPMLVAYVIFPVLGSIIGFFVSDIAGQCEGEDNTIA